MRGGWKTDKAVRTLLWSQNASQRNNHSGPKMCQHWSCSQPGLGMRPFRERAEGKE